MYDLLDLEEDPSYPVANIQEALSHLSGPLSTWLEEQEANLNSLQAAEVATKTTEQEESLERQKRSSVEEVEEGDFQLEAKLCEVSERVFRPRAARRSANLNDTQVISWQKEFTGDGLLGLQLHQP